MTACEPGSPEYHRRELRPANRYDLDPWRHRQVEAHLQANLAVRPQDADLYQTLASSR